MLPNYYKLLGISDFSDLDGYTKAKACRMFDELTPNKNLISVASRMLTGVQLLSDPVLKESYDYLLRKGWIAVFTDTLELIDVLTVIAYKRTVNTIMFFVVFLRA